MRLRLVAVLAASLLLLLGAPASADPGDIDPTSGFLGRTWVERMTGDPVATGASVFAPIGCGNSDCGTLARINAGGTVDVGFAAGEVPFPITRLVDVGDSLLALGYGSVARYSLEGQLDRTFGTAGVVTLPAGAQARAAARAPDGKLYVTALDAVSAGSCYRTDALVLRLTAAGSLDAAFGNAGTLRLDSGLDDDPTAITADAAGITVGLATTRVREEFHCIVRDADRGGLVARYRTDGTPETAFGFNGVVALPTTHVAAGIPDAGGVGLARSPRLGLLAARGARLHAYDPATGAPRATFGLGPMFATAVTLDADDRIIVSGSHVARLQSDGAADIGFGSCGYSPVAGRAIVTPDGRDLLVRPSGEVLVRLTGDGGQAAPMESGIVAVDASGAVRTSGALWCGPDRAPGANPPVVGIANRPTGNGYWTVAADGTVRAYAHAHHLGDMAGRRLNLPIVGMAPTPTGRGYWLVARDGGIFSFGDARFFGSAGNIRLNKPIVGMTATPSGNGYWFVASDGGIFAYGDARFHGSTGATPLASPITGMAATPSGGGYYLVGADGGIFPFGDAAWNGAAVGRVSRAVAVIAVSSSTYTVVSADGRVVTPGSDVAAPSVGPGVVAADG